MVAVVAVAGIALLAVDLDNSPETIASFNSDSATTTTTTTTTAPTTTSSTTTTTTTTTTTSTTSTTSTTTTTELPKQSTEPIAPPSNPHGAENLGQLGSMSIPKIGVDAPLLEGIRLTTLDQGPGHWPGTAMPGEVGNVVVAGHRTSHEADFRHLDQLVPGDDVVFSTGAGVITYKVTGTHIVQPDAIWIVDPTDTPTATLFACHPLGSTAQRIVVNLELAS
jgi:sortase A